ncbi:monovalent cation/hydrogen antiporter [Frankia sp. AiPs1]
MGIVLALVILATVVATFARRLSVPAPSLLVVAGVLVGLLPGVPQVRVAPDVVSVVVLPPLLYAAAEELSWRDLRAVQRPVTILALGLVVASAAAVGLLALAVTPLSADMAFVLGAVLASTDPVAVSALGRRLALPPRVQALVQAESLFNDATSLVLFRVAVGIAVTSGAISWVHVVGEFVWLAGGGAVVGALVAAGVTLIRRRTEDPVLETVIALVTPYTCYLLAERLAASGISAVVVAGVILGTQTADITTSRIRLQLHAVYGTVVFLLESVVFALIGLQLPTLIRDLSRAGTWWPLAALAISGTLLAIRAVWVFPLSAAMQRRRGTRPSWRVPLVVSWAGARGVLPLAAALSIPLTDHAGHPLQDRELVLLLTATVIVMTLTVQGFTLAPLVRRTGIALTSHDTILEGLRTRLQITYVALERLDQMTDLEVAPEVVIARLHRELTSRIDQLEAGRHNGRPDPTADSYRWLRRDLIAVESAELNRLYETGHISDTTRRNIQHALDLEDTGLGDD